MTAAPDRWAHREPQIFRQTFFMKNANATLKSELKKNIKLQKKHMILCSKIRGKLDVEIKKLSSFRSEVKSATTRAFADIAVMLDVLAELEKMDKKPKRGKKLPS